MLKEQPITKVLDHGQIKLIDYMGGDEAIVRSARVSHQQSDTTGDDLEGDHKLIKFLHANGHNTPRQSTFFTFYVKLPIFVVRQWHRHRTQSYNEASARYSVLPECFYIPEAHLIGKAHPTNKQARVTITKEEFEELSFAEQAPVLRAIDIMRVQNVRSFEAYKDMLDSGVPKELARSVLPVATYTEMFTSVDLHNLFGFLWERMHEHAQYEIRVYANAIFDIIEPIAPFACEAFKKAMVDAGRL